MAIDQIDNVMPTKTEEALLLTVEEAARSLRIGRTQMYQLVTTGAVQSVRIGRLRRVPVESLHDYVSMLRAHCPAQRNAA
ncbi:helix-turn-helix domain-containing protein [Nonomuraea lactucae]|uniref:helix-turn-helix domain-containing protein n=1 Tax=Nonomuraea lactucae TaxID=2249762 RepID=UPI001F067B1E|nr:helix-turn-helix domain-containing protein [Nonomuraea lactucae]